jgi:hypothetical protein
MCVFVQAYVALGEVPGWWEGAGGGDYPMDYYAAEGGQYNGTYHRRKARAPGAPAPAAIAAAARAAKQATASVT